MNRSQSWEIVLRASAFLAAMEIRDTKLAAASTAIAACS
jgi:hypothetical protein